MRSHRHTALGLLPLLLAQLLPGQQTASFTSGEGLKILVVKGEGSKYNVRRKTAEELVVRLVDSAEKPVAGAQVVFQVPYAGPGGRFYDWLQMQSVKTDSEGIAQAKGLTPNDEVGQWNMKVVAQDGNRNATALVPQVNVQGEGPAASGKSRKALWIALAAIGAAAIAGGIAAASGGSAVTTPGRPVVVAPGPITVGGPR